MFCEIKSLILFCALLILLQSCVAYQTSSVSLPEASGKGRARVVCATGQTFDYSDIYFNAKDSTYFGVERGALQSQLNPMEITAVYLQDVPKSKRNTILLGIAHVGVALIIYATLSVDLWWTM